MVAVPAYDCLMVQALLPTQAAPQDTTSFHPAQKGPAAHPHRCAGTSLCTSLVPGMSNKHHANDCHVTNQLITLKWNIILQVLPPHFDAKQTALTWVIRYLPDGL